MTDNVKAASEPLAKLLRRPDRLEPARLVENVSHPQHAGGKLLKSSWGATTLPAPGPRQWCFAASRLRFFLDGRKPMQKHTAISAQNTQNAGLLGLWKSSGACQSAGMGSGGLLNPQSASSLPPMTMTSRYAATSNRVNRSSILMKMTAA